MKTNKTMRVDSMTISYQPGTSSLVRAMVRAADEGGTIQADRMICLSSDPRHHTATSLAAALARVGAKVQD
jgi:hypothetical protein